MHGLLQSSDAWFDASPGTGLAYLLADECFDVWVGNQRGNYYARRHLTLNPDKDSAFWDFSIDQIGYYDIPATIDYVLSNTGVKKLNYIGFSQGAGTFLVMCSERPEYSKKSNVLISISPATRVKNTKSKSFRSLLNILSTYEGLLAQLKINELFAKESFLQVLFEFICQIRLFSEPLCENFLCGILDSSHPGSITHKTLAMVYSHLPAGTSLRNMARYGQSLNAEDFQKYDFGETVNVVKYGSKKPPGYNLSSISLPVVIIYGANDHLVDTKDISWLVDKLPNVIGLEEVADPLWNHFDSVGSQHFNKMIWPTVNRYLERFSDTYMKTKS
ncbi:lipase 1-like [Leptidea sinapis]|uniref:lipase 1-like n=1 Tax=Leptidea sinapis TaxID=189913 RepID=UPI0021C2EAAA|nr:lipase 1-like [Leptidea sinapis]